MQAKKIFRNIIIAILSITIYNIYAINNTYADDTITITLPSSSVNLPITPSSSGVFNSTDINVQVTTSNTAGYTLSMTAADVNLTRTAAVNGTTPTIPTFTSLSGYTSGTTYSQANFPTGYWGYKLSSDTNYSPISSSITIADPDESTANTAISNVITFAAKLDNSKPAGSYTTTLTFTATGKTPPITLISFTIDDTTYQAEDGMTWEEWVNSDYNVNTCGVQVNANTDIEPGPGSTCGFSATGSFIIKGGNYNTPVGVSRCNSVRPTDTIIANQAYISYNYAACD